MSAWRYPPRPARKHKTPPATHIAAALVALAFLLMIT